MAGGRDLFKVLETRFACPTSWEGMEGGAERRFCGECRREVFDFARMSPRAVEARLEVSGGKLCARVTRENGRVKTLAPELPAPPLLRTAERAPAIAAGVFGAWLTVASVQASAAPAAPAAVVSASEDPHQDPASIPPSPMDGGAPAAGAKLADEAAATAADAGEQVTLGEIVVIEPTLRESFDSSDLVFAGSVRESEILEVRDEVAEMRTTLRVERHWKGTVRERFVTYRHSLPVEALAPEYADQLPELQSGSKILAFLTRAEGEAGVAGRPVYESTGFGGGLRSYPADEMEAYADRLAELADLHHEAGPRAELDEAGLMEWLVAMAENPFTRKENTSDEIWRAIDDFAAFAAAQPEPAAGGGRATSPSALLGAAFTARQQERLTAALQATEGLAGEDLRLYWLVDRLDPAAARGWLLGILRGGRVVPDGDSTGLLEELAVPLAADASAAFMKAAEGGFQAIDGLWPEDESEAIEAARQEKRRELTRMLFAELAALLESAE